MNNSKDQTKSSIRILHLEDNPSDSHLVQSVLKKANFDFEYFLADNEKDFIINLENKEIDVILSDYHLPDYSGSEALIFAKTNYPQIPFVFLSGTMGEEAAIESLLNGAIDYVLKNKMDRLISAIQRAYNESQEHKARQEAEKALFQSEENFRRSIYESLLGIRIVSVEGETIYVNKAFLDIYEFENLDEYISTPSKDRLTPESYLQHQERKSIRIEGKDVPNYELGIMRKNGEIRYVDVSRKEILWNGIKHYQVINQDITEQKKLTADLIAAKEKAEESERLKSAFLANMSHEIRTPMNGILGFAELLKQPNLSGAEQQQYIQIIEKSGARMLNIINDIIDISKIESGQMKVSFAETNINEQLEFIYSFFKGEVEQKGLRIFCKNAFQTNQAIIVTDREKLFAILSNLVKNAIKYTKEGLIEFGYNIDSGRNKACVRDKACLVSTTTMEFFVKDTGIGIPEARQDAIFERFIQAEIRDKMARQGAGLGLAISKSYVEMLGGKIWVESEEGKGSTFYFTLPYKAKPEEKQMIINEVLSDIKENQMNKLKVLIAEDDESSEMLISIGIEKFSKEILKVRTGQSAVEACRENPDIDLILMDIQMPEMDGYEATRQIRQFNKNVIIIAQTAYALTGDRENAMEAGCTDYISKPIRRDKLDEIIHKHFDN